MKNVLIFVLLVVGVARAQSGLYSDYVLEPSIFKFMPASLKAAKEDFAERLQTVTPVVESDGYYFGSGCKAHECNMDEAAWAINEKTGTGTAVIMRHIPAIPGGTNAHENFEVYGAASEELPSPLAAWATQEGMTAGNVVELPSVMAIDPGK